MRKGIQCTSCFPSRNGKCCNVNNVASLDVLHPTLTPTCRKTSEEPRGLSAANSILEQRPTNSIANCPTNLIAEVASSISESFVRSKNKILKRIPRASRGLAAKKLTSLLDSVVANNNSSSWLRLLHFAQCSLQIPVRQKEKLSLASIVNKQIRNGCLPPHVVTLVPGRKRRVNKVKDPLEILAGKVSAKLEEGDLRGAVRLACSEETIAEYSDETFSALQAKHPHPSADSVITPLVSQNEIFDKLSVSDSCIAYAIRSFFRGSAGGPDGMTPQHLKDMTGMPAGEGRLSLLSALSSFVHFVLRGEVLAEVRPIFFGANLVAFNKKGGGVRPIAMGCTLRRLVAKCAGLLVRDEMGELLAPRQLGYGVKRGSEAAVHAARQFVCSM